MDLERIYRYRFRDVDAGGRRAVWEEIAGHLYTRLGEPQRVLDPAAGSGEFIEAVPAAERWAVALVYDGLAARAVAGPPSVRVVIGPVLDVELPEGHFDLVFASNLLEHLASPDEVAAVLRRFRSLLRPGGTLAVLGPNFRYVGGSYFDCADHVLALTHVSVAEHLYGAGFEVGEVVARFLPYSFRSRLPASRLLTRAYLRTPVAWRLLGKQFLVTGTRS